MKLKIRGEEYDFRNLANAAPLHMIELQQQSKKLVEGGWRISILRQAERENRAYARQRVVWEEDGFDPDTEPEEPESMWVALATTTFLTMRSGGTRITLEEAASIPMSEMEFVPDPGDEVDGGGDEADPTTPGTPDSGGPATSGADPSPVEAAGTTGPSSGSGTP